MLATEFEVEGRIVDVVNRRIFAGRVSISDGRIVGLVEDAGVQARRYIMPGFVDAHVHIESSMLVPSEFGRAALVHGTVATVSDPHEIANVLGLDGVRYMIDDAARTPLKIYFGAPSCVPATAFESAGAHLGPEDVRRLFEEDGLLYLSEMMNYPGVLFGDEEVHAKLNIARELGRRIDGHAPGLRGDDARRYIEAGPQTDHECFTLEEALDKLQYGMRIAIREGSAARNYAALSPLLRSHPDMVFLCSDDKHPNDLVRGHIDEVVRRAISEGYDRFDVLRAASLNPIEHYGLDVGCLRPGDPADFIFVDDVDAPRARETWINGICVARDGGCLIASVNISTPNKFEAEKISAADLRIAVEGATSDARVRVIEALDGQLITGELEADLPVVDGAVTGDLSTDTLKLVVHNRYSAAPPAIAFIRNIGLTCGAIASSVAHDSHNIIAVGVSDAEICAAVNALVDSRGGLSLVDGDDVDVLPLPVAGLMSAGTADEVARDYERLDRKAHELGSKLRAPYMTLSFMALLVIPELKLSDKGLFTSTTFGFSDLLVKRSS